VAGERVLVIDDELAVVYEHALQRKGFELATAADGFEGLNKVREFKPDLILLDYMMPGMDGIKVLDQLKKDKNTVPVILITARGDEKIAVQAFHRGVKDYIVKSVSLDELCAVVESNLVELRLRREMEVLTESVVLANTKRMHELEIMHTVSKSIVNVMDKDSFMQSVVNAAAMLTTCDEAALFLLEEDNSIYCIAKTVQNEQPQYMHVTVLDALAHEAMEAGQVITSPPGNLDEKANGIPLFKAIAAPLIVEERRIGAFVVKYVSDNQLGLSRGDATVLATLASYLADVIEVAPYDTILKQIRMNIHPLPKIFISYSQDDWEEFVKPLVNILRNDGFPVWIDKQLLQPGQDWMDEINKALMKCDCMVLCVTPQALDSEFVKMEYRYFIEKKKPLIPLLCRDAEMPFELSGLQHLPSSDMRRVAEQLKKLTDKHGDM
jgi:DNA-binding response OmpR family regulator